MALCFSDLDPEKQKARTVLPSGPFLLGGAGVSFPNLVSTWHHLNADTDLVFSDQQKLFPQPQVDSAEGLMISKPDFSRPS